MPSTFLEIYRLPVAGAMRPYLRSLLPTTIKLAYRLAKNNLRDLRTGTFFKIAQPCHSHSIMPHAVEVSQPIVANAWLASKQHNFRLASNRVNSVTLQPAQVFSFWKTIGNPTAEKGFKKGRNLVNGQVCETFGGGLCQLSGIIYHTSLVAGLVILERHNHSVDIYANGEPRFTPLGADATVAFGYKDLRVGNPFDFAVRFDLEIVGETLVCRLRSEEPIMAYNIEFQAVSKPGLLEVATWKRSQDDGLEFFGKSVYRLPS